MLFVETDDSIPALEVYSDNVPTFEYGEMETSPVQSKEQESPSDSFLEIAEMEKNGLDKQYETEFINVDLINQSVTGE